MVVFGVFEVPLFVTLVIAILTTEVILALVRRINRRRQITRMIAELAALEDELAAVEGAEFEAEGEVEGVGPTRIRITKVDRIEESEDHLDLRRPDPPLVA